MKTLWPHIKTSKHFPDLPFEKLMRFACDQLDINPAIIVVKEQANARGVFGDHEMNYITIDSPACQVPTQFIFVLFHELVHVKQHYDGVLGKPVYCPDYAFSDEPVYICDWCGAEYIGRASTYNLFPWEVEANVYADKLLKMAIAAGILPVDFQLGELHYDAESLAQVRPMGKLKL